MTDWKRQIEDRDREFDTLGAARAPATFTEAMQAEWRASGLDTLFGVGKPFNDAFGELQERLGNITGRSMADHFAADGVQADKLGIDGKIDAIGRIIDRLPDNQQKLLADYKDVRARARAKAAEIERQSADVAGATYGPINNAAAFLSGAMRQMVDPVNLALAPVGPARLAAGAGARAVGLFLAKEALAGAAVQAVQEPVISQQRAALGLESDSFQNILEAGLGQAGLSGLFMAGGAALRRLRAEGKPVPKPLENIAPEDAEAMGRQAERDAHMERLAGDPVRGAEAIEAARASLETGKPVEGIAPARAAQFDLSQPRAVRIGDDLTVQVRYQLMDLADLKVSHGLDGAENPGYPQMLQPRDRSEAASQAWVRQEAARLDPEQLGPASTPQQGAPIVAADGVVESGNGRALLLAQAYRDFPEKAEAYRAYLDDLGFDTAQMERPVLVRVREGELTPEQRIAFTREANVTATAALAPAARAKVDAGKIDDSLMALWGGTANVDTQANARFVQGFAARAVARTELPDFIRADGTLTEMGAKRIRSALVARAWREDDIIAKAADDTSGTSRMIVDALIDTAPVAARLRAAVEEGRIPREMDVGADVIAAFRLVEQARKSGQKVAALVDQTDLERGAVPQAVRDAVALFFRDPDFTIAASAREVADRIGFALDHALMRQQADLFGETVDRAGLLRAARLNDETLDETPLPALERARKRTEAAQAKPEAETKLQPAKLPPEYEALERQLTAVLGDISPEAKAFDIGRTDAEGEMKPGSARELMDEHKARVQAAAELQDCVARTGGVQNSAIA
ncbi:MAG: hypothetical protein IOC42_06085 [Methylobacterium sp.]|nr:hypothetical protein [Methylobacterium sp.]MCA3675529.1 hypothetical protein [Methylobacterium sp.]